MKMIVMIFIYICIQYQAFGESIVSKWITNNLTGNFSEYASRPDQIIAKVEKYNERYRLFQQRANTCEADLSLMEADPNFTKRNESLFLVATTYKEYAEGLSSWGFVFKEQRDYKRQYNCQSYLDKHELNLPKKLFGSFVVKALKPEGKICSEYERMVACFQNFEKIIMDNKDKYYLEYDSPRFGEMKGFSYDFYDEFSRSRAN